MQIEYIDSFPSDFDENGYPFGSENRKENCHHDNFSWKLIFQEKSISLFNHKKNLQDPPHSAILKSTGYIFVSVDNNNNLNEII